MTDTSIDIPNPVAYKLNQKDLDLIWTLNSVEWSWTVVPYISGGIYDRIFENLKQYSKEKLTNWYRLQYFKSPKVLLIQKPGKRVYTKEKAVVDGGHTKLSWDFDDNFKLIQKSSIGYVNSYCGVVKVQLYFYNNSVENAQGYTFGDSSQVIKPFTKLQHKWKDISYKSQYVEFKCMECELPGKLFYNNNNFIIPDEFLTCEEYKMKSIIM